MKFLHVLLSFVFFLSGLFFWLYRGCERVPQDVLTVALVHDLPLGSSGDVHHGFNSDIAFFIGQKLNKQIKRKVLWASDVVTALQKNEVDIVCAPLNITDERLEKMAMVHVYGGPYPYLTLLFGDASYKKELEGVKHIRDTIDFLEKRGVGASLLGIIWEGVLKKYGIKNIKTYEQEPQLISALRRGEVAAIVVGRVSTDFLLNQNSNLWALKVALDKPYSYGVGVALSKERKGLTGQVRDIIQDLKDDGTIKMLQQKWFSKEY